MKVKFVYLTRGPEFSESEVKEWKEQMPACMIYPM